MNRLENIKREIRRLYETVPEIHINVAIKKPKIDLQNQFVTITGVYPNIFRIEERDKTAPKAYSIQYADVLLGNIEIMELQQ